MANRKVSEATAQVSKTCLFSWGGNQYSVPHHLARFKVVLHIYEDHLDVLYAGKVVVSLPRHPGKGHRIVQDEHYAGRPAGSKRAGLQQRFEAIGPEAAPYLRGLALSHSGGLREQAETILELVESYGHAAVFDIYLVHDQVRLQNLPILTERQDCR